MPFFQDDDYYTGPSLSIELVAAAEERLGFKLPVEYLRLLEERNGGVPVRQCFPMREATSWARDHFRIEAIRGIGGEWGIDNLNLLGSANLICEWGYPDIGVVVCELSSGGHDTVMLDYSGCGPRGEPSVVYIDEDRVPRLIAMSFGQFAERLVNCRDFDKC